MVELYALDRFAGAAHGTWSRSWEMASVKSARTHIHPYFSVTPAGVFTV